MFFVALGVELLSNMCWKARPLLLGLYGFCISLSTDKEKYTKRTLEPRPPLGFFPSAAAFSFRLPGTILGRLYQQIQEKGRRDVIGYNEAYLPVLSSFSVDLDRDESSF
jgi:hypothetical protein